MEDKLVASALAPQHLASALGGDLPGAALDGTAAASWPSGGAGSGGFGGGFATGPASTEMQSMGSIGMPAPQFDADFEEIMRRLDEDERMESSLGGSTLQGPASSPKPLDGGAASKSAGAAGSNAAAGGVVQPTVLSGLDAGTMLDVSYGAQDDEDELLNCIEDIDSLDLP